MIESVPKTGLGQVAVAGLKATGAVTSEGGDHDRGRRRGLGLRKSALAVSASPACPHPNPALPSAMDITGL